jgi:hypothetical protein
LYITSAFILGQALGVGEGVIVRVSVGVADGELVGVEVKTDVIVLATKVSVGIDSTV